MPTYEYECTGCEYTFDEFQKITDRPLTKCPKCGGPVRRLISGGAGLIFRGSGFYVTDYKRLHLPQNKEDKGSQIKNPDDKPGMPAAVPKDKKD
ncbi:zinc ribbon domain-containing protein [candidate division WOR-3 bacterium]|nr:zinc ribbon domain-containing protein [candidate division WOR-3 bacterium]